MIFIIHLVHGFACGYLGAHLARKITESTAPFIALSIAFAIGLVMTSNSIAAWLSK